VYSGWHTVSLFPLWHAILQNFVLMFVPKNWPLAQMMFEIATYFIFKYASDCIVALARVKMLVIVAGFKLTNPLSFVMFGVKPGF